MFLKKWLFFVSFLTTSIKDLFKSALMKSPDRSLSDIYIQFGMKKGAWHIIGY